MDKHKYCAGCICLTCVHYGGDTSGHCCDRASIFGAPVMRTGCLRCATILRKSRYGAIAKALFSSNSDDWSTPQSFFDVLNGEFGFDLDPCADSDNHKCDLWFSKDLDGLTQDWGGIPFFAILLIAR